MKYEENNKSRPNVLVNKRSIMLMHIKEVTDPRSNRIKHVKNMLQGVFNYITLFSVR